ncbi:CFEM domain-containing protein [Colletotrichum tamarilloi]|uniref:CFEM domain-containing protein n=1 Tax=Colletotrichum tamarilloi TaxID=1209934 RepID=A0ABQ9R6K0_9PEZI|nr:CFEM domain-containing protein [Colletotrichum tamarilloi]KAK1496560.1 CFEM domain-containing protein [Colletotrichum tamarilloi]
MALQLADGLPDCAIPCLSQAVNITTCAVTNLTTTCLCQDKPAVEAFRVCIRSIAGKVSLVIITAVFVLARMLSKFLRLSTWGPDDFTLILGYQTNMPQKLTNQLGNRQVFFAFEVIYTLSISALKASILFFYIRVFSMVSRTFSLVLWLTQTFNFLFCLAFTVANLNQCRPFSNAWEGWDGRHPGYCINVYAMFIAHAAINIALDVWMLGLPVTQVLWLNLRKRQKVEIVVMFSLGVVITIVSAVRLKVLLSLEGFQDPTYDAFYLHMWSYIELSVGIIVACLPSTRQVWRHLVPKLLRLVGLGSPKHHHNHHHGHERPGDSAKKLRDILFMSTNTGGCGGEEGGEEEHSSSSAGPSSPSGSSTRRQEVHCNL